MKYIVSWRIAPQNHQRAAEVFLARGAPAPDGLTILGRWHAPGSARGWVLAEGDPAALAQHLAEWGHLLEFPEVMPVVEDEDAAKALSKVYG